jgi:cytosine deaminase
LIRHKQRGKVELDVEGGLVTESFVIGQLHLDKMFTGPWLDSSVGAEYTIEAMAGAMTAIELASEVKKRYEEAEGGRAGRTSAHPRLSSPASPMSALSSTSTTARLVGLRGVLRAKEHFAVTVDLQIVAPPQDGLLRDPGPTSSSSKRWG